MINSMSVVRLGQIAMTSCIAAQQKQLCMCHAGTP